MIRLCKAAGVPAPQFRQDGGQFVQTLRRPTGGDGARFVRPESGLESRLHRQVVLTIPKRLRPYCLYRRALLGDLAWLAARIVTAGVRATTGESDLRVGIIACLQTHGSLAKWSRQPSAISRQAALSVSPSPCAPVPR
jgi:hypothetical protein